MTDPDTLPAVSAADQPAAAVDATATTPIMALLANADLLAQVNPDTIERLVRLENEQRERREKAEFDAAFRRVQSEMPPVYKGGHNPQSKSHFVQLEHLARTIYPLLRRHGFRYSSSMAEPRIEGRLCIELALSHEGGHEERFRMDAEPDTHGLKGAPNKTGQQGSASTLTFCTRQLLLSALCVVTTRDDDGVTGPSADAEPVTFEQAVRLRELAESIDRFDAAPLFAWAGVPDGEWEQLPASRYTQIESRLRARANR